MLNTHSKVFMCTQQCSGGIQYSLTGIHAHSITFRGCSILTKMWSFSWSHHHESHSIITQWHSRAFDGHSHLLNGIHVHSMGVQELFPFTHWHSCTLNGWSVAVSDHSKAFACTQHSIQGVFNIHSKTFNLKAQWICFQICKAC